MLAWALSQLTWVHLKAVEPAPASTFPELTKGTLAWYAGTRAKAEARAALEQEEELRRALQDLGERLDE